MIHLMFNFFKKPFHGVYLVFSLLPSIFVLLKSRTGKSLTNIDFIKNKDKCIVIGNGPSLSNDLDAIEKKIANYDVCCVNNFVVSPYFIKFRPCKYIFQDTYFWAENAHSSWIKQREETFDLLNKNVTWDMQIFIPMHADKHFFETKITNTYIEIIQQKTVAIEHVESNFAYMLFNTGYFSPCRWNVLITAIYLSIHTRYKQIEIYGADMSFYKDIDVDQKTNELLFNIKHFYGETKTEIYTHNPEKTRKVTMDELMNVQKCIFFAHKVLSGYAEYLHISIINKSSYSLIDTYKRT